MIFWFNTFTLFTTCPNGLILSQEYINFSQATRSKYLYILNISIVFNTPSFVLWVDTLVYISSWRWKVLVARDTVFSKKHKIMYGWCFFSFFLVISYLIFPHLVAHPQSMPWLQIMVWIGSLTFSETCTWAPFCWQQTKRGALPPQLSTTPTGQEHAVLGNPLYFHSPTVPDVLGVEVEEVTRTTRQSSYHPLSVTAVARWQWKGCLSHMPVRHDGLQQGPGLLAVHWNSFVHVLKYALSGLVNGQITCQLKNCRSPQQYSHL